jgi:hypothetical protein
MKKQEPDPASGTTPAKESGKQDNVDAKTARRGAADFEPNTELDGKTDSGPEPDVFGQELPPQD